MNIVISIEIRTESITDRSISSASVLLARHVRNVCKHDAKRHREHARQGKHRKVPPEPKPVDLSNQSNFYYLRNHVVKKNKLVKNDSVSPLTMD